MAAQGWCPSTHRIYAAPDGGLARVKVPGGQLDLGQLRAVARAAGAWGNGVVDLTTRANLQVRGVDPDAAPALRALLAPIGLSAPTATMEDRRNVMASPAAGLDPEEILDVRPLAAAIVAALDALPEALPLPHKVGVLLDGGGTPSLRGIATDVALGAVRMGDGTVRLAVAFGRSLDNGAVATIALDDAPALVAAAARLCATPPDGEPPSRMAALVTALGPAAVLDHLAPSADLGPVTTHVAVSGPEFGGRDGGRTAEERPWVEVRAATEPVTAATIEALADAVEASGATEVRLTPWRSIVVAEPTDIPQAEALLLTAGWTTEPATEPVTVRRTVGAVA